MMKIVKMIPFFLVFFVMLVIGNNCSADRISVCDSTVDVFCEDYNNIVKSVPDKNGILIEKEKMIKKKVDDLYLVIFPLRNCVNGNGTHVNFIMNSTNNIYQIEITNNMNATKEDTFYAYITVLKVLDVPNDDIEFFLDLSEPKYKPISEKRTLVAGFRPARPNIGFDTFTIAAFDNNGK